ncbi:MAG TPA: 2-C-methyl-D-erythritol 4-phosphate cytidylyltransferase [Egibacteraceae bacterium]|nr:2-C-methyl-D-erythritol 4-phosphate cytidylyltransferase [Actinomycetota bacterium]HWB73084.1 2-C-methyl-D-erythritol 4-phosphate cytidylyltransferase [Egibacteraceae bacterium]
MIAADTGSRPRTAAVLVAGGSGERLEAGIPKAFVELGGQPMLVHAARAFVACAAVDDLVCVVGAGQVGRARQALDRAGLEAVAVTVGGTSRQQSVSRGLAGCPPSAHVVAVHDVARPLVSAQLIARTIAALTAPWDAVAPGLPVVDTLKLLDHGRQEVLRTVDRRGLWAVQTPQVLERRTLERVHACAAGASEATDDLSLVERAGGRVRLIEGDRSNLKITFPGDLALAELVLAARHPNRAPAPRV